MNTRRSRDARPVARRYRVTARDIEIVFAVGRMAQATSDQIRRLFFRDPSTAARRLSKLVALFLLDVHMGAPNEPNVYTLGRRALVTLEKQGMGTSQLHRSRVR